MRTTTGASDGVVPPASTARLRDRLAAVLAAGVPDGAGGSARVRRAWPRDLDDPARGYVLELVHPADGVLGGLLDADGAWFLRRDRALPRLSALRDAPTGGGPRPGERPDHLVVAHRPRKRAVLRAGDGSFVKLARPAATRRALRALAAVDALLGGDPARPTVLAADPSAGELRLAPAAGHPLAAVLARGGDEADRAVTGVARALLALARVGAPPARGPGETPDTPRLPEPVDTLGRHTLADEAVVLTRWVGAALACAPLRPGERGQLTRAAETVAELESGAAADGRGFVLAHRDLHDGQILLGADGAVTVLDWDTAAWADPAADVANLLAHLDRAGHAGPAQALQDRLARDGHPAYADPHARARLVLLRRATALRLAAVHAFRPR